MPKYIHIINIVRGIGPTSMPWNDLYNNTRRLSPGIAHTPIAVTSIFGSAFIKKEQCNGVLRRFINSSMIAALVRINKIYKKSKNNKRVIAIHIHNPSLAILAFCIKILCPKIIILVNLHNDWRFFRIHQRIGLWISAYLADHLITVSKSIITSIPKFIRNHLLINNKLTAIPNGIRADVLRQYIHTNTRENVAVVIARMVPQKNCLFILNVLANTPSVDRLIWIGTGFEKNDILHQITNLNITNKVELMGVIQRNKVYEILSKSSIYIAASKWEGIGVANIEAAALGCWPFLSSIGPHIEISQEVGFDTYSLNNSMEWSCAIENFLSQSNKKIDILRDSLISNTLEKYDLNDLILKYIKIYNEFA